MASVSRGDSFFNSSDHDSEEDMLSRTPQNRTAPQKPKKKAGFPVVGMIIVLVVGGVLGFFGARMFGSKSLPTAQSSSKSNAIASYERNGKRTDVTVGDLLGIDFDEHSLSKDDTLPSSDIITGISTLVLADEARAQGITVSDNDVAIYAEFAYGSSDYASLGDDRVSADQIKTSIENELLVEKLKDKVWNKTDATKLPDLPVAPKDEKDIDTATSEYAQYIVGLLGDEWNAQANTWARQDGPFYRSIDGASFSPESATYAQAMKAYYVARLLRSNDNADALTAWNEYSAKIMSEVTVVLYGIGF